MNITVKSSFTELSRFDDDEFINKLYEIEFPEKNFNKLFDIKNDKFIFKIDKTSQVTIKSTSRSVHFKGSLESYKENKKIYSNILDKFDAFVYKINISYSEDKEKIYELINSNLEFNHLKIKKDGYNITFKQLGEGNKFIIDIKIDKMPEGYLTKEEIESISAVEQFINNYDTIEKII